jgi:hypothetical protein
MRSHRIITHSLAAIVATAALVLAPATAQAGSLLSGYGGPGEGNQAVLGSALIGGSRGGSGGSGSGDGSGSETSGGSSESDSSSSSGEAGGGSGGTDRGASKGGSARNGAGKGANGATHGDASATGTSGASGAQAQQFASFYPAAERVPSGGQGVVLGLTGQDIFLIVLAAVVLIAIGLVTRRLDRPTAGQADPSS